MVKKSWRVSLMPPLAHLASVFVGAVALMGPCPFALAASAHAAPSKEAVDFLSANRDLSVQPGQDFFQYANGGWLKRHPIPATESAWGIAQVIQEQLYVNLRKINEQAAESTHQNTNDAEKIANFWLTAMDTDLANALGVLPLQPELQKIAAIKTASEALDLAFEFQRLQVGAFFNLSVSQDAKASDQMAVHLWQGGLGLPERDYYFNPDAAIVHSRHEYVAHIARTLALLDHPKGNLGNVGKGAHPTAAQRAAAAQVMAFETHLAQASRRLEALRDPVKNYNKMTPSAFTENYTPSIFWSDRLADMQLTPAEVIVGQPEFFAALQGLLKSTPVAVLRDYLRFHLVDTYSPYLSQAFESEHFQFHNSTLLGQKQARPRWKRVIDAEEGAMGMVVGRLFVQAFFNETAKQRYENLVEAFRAAYLSRIDRLDWMGDDTKAKARTKLAAITKKVGYPDHWKDFSTLQFSRTSYADNMMASARWHFADMLSKQGQPVDRTEWEMTPQTYNAYYNPSNNEIVLPAASFLVPGMQDADVDDAVVYGYAGASTIGHEITHGFDDQGRQFDAAGNLTDWWREQDAEKFNARASVMVKQFNAYQPLPGLHINGQASLGENIADYGGLLLGIDAFKKTRQYQEGQTIAGLTPMQRFFLGYALGWMAQQRDAALRRNLLSDVHAPAKWRVLGPLSNLPDFYDAFGVKPGQPMFRPEALRVHIW
jgi:putative endopeptidase